MWRIGPSDVFDFFFFFFQMYKVSANWHYSNAQVEKASRLISYIQRIRKYMHLVYHLL